MVSEDLETQINTARGNGQPLSEEVRQPMEQAFGTDFSEVKIHTDANADSLSQSLQAQAFTTREDIFFREGQYSPGSDSGRKLIAHELTHVVQQSGTRSKRVQDRPSIGALRQLTEQVKSRLAKSRSLRGKGTVAVQRENLDRKPPPLPSRQGRSAPPRIPPPPPSKQGRGPVPRIPPPIPSRQGRGPVPRIPPPIPSKQGRGAPPPISYEYKPREGFDASAYSKALEKFKPMKKPRLLGGLKKSDRRIEAMKYLKETAEASKGYHPNPQKVVNSIMEAYKDTFREELKEGAATKLGAKEKLKLMGQKIKEFVKNVFSIKWWIGKLIELKEWVMDPPAALTEQTHGVLTLLGGGCKSLAKNIGPYVSWLPIAGLVSSIIDVGVGVLSSISKFKDTIALGKAADAAQKKEEPSAVLLADAAEYGFRKVLRGFMSRFFDLVMSFANLVLSILGVIGGVFSAGIGLAITTGISIGLSLVAITKTAMTKLKGFWKWITGKRGKARRENAKKIVMAAREGSDEALNLILKLDLSGIAGGNELKQFWYYLRSWVAKGGEQNKQILVDMLKGWDEKVIDTLVKGVAEKLKSQ